MNRNNEKTAYVPCKTFRQDGKTLTVGISQIEINDRPAPNEVYFLVERYGEDEAVPEALATFTPDKAVEVAEALLKFSRMAKLANGTRR